MTRFPSGLVPEDTWICCKCKNPNLIALMSEKCSVCDHTKDDSCTGPNQPYPDAAGLFSTSSTSTAASNLILYRGDTTDDFGAGQTYQNGCFTSDCGANSFGWENTNTRQFGHGQDTAPVTVPARFFSNLGFRSLAYAGTPAPGSWTCTCGATNSDLTADFCPICGETR